MGLRVRVVLVVPVAARSSGTRSPVGAEFGGPLEPRHSPRSGSAARRTRRSVAIPNAPWRRLVERYHQVYGEGLLIVDSDGRTLAARGLDHSAPGVATAADHALVDAPASRWTRDPGRWDRPPGNWSPRVCDAKGNWLAPSCWCSTRRVAARDVAKGWLWVAVGCWVARAGRPGRPCPYAVGAPPARRAGARGRRDDRRGRRAARRCGRAAGTASLHLGVQHDGAGGPGLSDRQRRLVADASHQLRNPLAAVRLRADSLEDHVAEAGRSTYGSMSAELDRLENLLHQLLRLARAEEVSGSRRVGLSTAVAESTDLEGRDRGNAWRSGSP